MAAPKLTRGVSGAHAPPTRVEWGMQTVQKELKRQLYQLLFMIASAAIVAWTLRLGPFASPGPATGAAVHNSPPPLLDGLDGGGGGDEL